MRVAVLPFNAAEGVKPALGRQFSAFAADQLRGLEGADINSVSYLTQIEQNGQPRVAYVNMSDGMLPFEQLAPLFQGDGENPGAEVVMDGFLDQEGDEFILTQRFHAAGSETPVAEERLRFAPTGVFDALKTLVANLAARAEVAVPEESPFGTEDPEAFLAFLEGHDSLSYIQQANGAVAVEFSPQGGIDALISAIERDGDFLGPYQALVQLCRVCVAYQIGSAEIVENALVRATTLEPNEFPAYFALAELYQAVGNLDKAADYLERAIQREGNDPGLYARLALVQAQNGMPVNAERNARRAMDLEGPDKPSADLLANLLQGQGRGHEIPEIYRAIAEAAPEDAFARAKYAVSLVNNEKLDDATREFERALEHADDDALPGVKRMYAPFLARQNEFDRAMDFYEDYLDVAPQDGGAQLEYAQVLEAAGREVDVPPVLKKVLALDPDPNTRAEVTARVIEMEQPKRAEAVENARKKMEEGDFAGAVRDLKPMRNWLADYWKLWALLASASNQLRESKDAEEASMRLIEMYPGCEPAYGELTRALIDQGRAREAFDFMGQVAQANPGSLPLHINLGLAAAKAGEKPLARNLAKQIREAVGPNPELDAVLAEMEA